MAKKAVKKSTKRSVKAKAKKASNKAKRSYNRRNYDDTARIRVVGEHNHKPTSSRGKFYAFLGKGKGATVGGYKELLKKMRKSDASAFIRNAVDEKYIRVAA
jgi:hypothetical protein